MNKKDTLPGVFAIPIKAGVSKPGKVSFHRSGDGRAKNSLPGVFTVPLKEVPAAPVPASRTFRVLGSNNGYGLSRDREIIVESFLLAGWSLVEDINVPAVLNVHLENIAPRHPAALRNVVIPNPEWWVAGRTPVNVWAKTIDSERIFRKIYPRVEMIGFRSVDQLDLTVKRERLFLHIAGDAPNKRSVQLLAAWRTDWPTITVVGSREILRMIPGTGSNIRLIGKRLSAEEVRSLQNSHLFHIYPSRYEGFGHAQWEGLSCGAIVFVQDWSPFEEWPEFLRMASTRSGTGAPNKLVQWCDVSSEGLAAAVARAEALSDEEIAAWRARSRGIWLANTQAFEARIGAQIAALDTRVTPPPCATGDLADLPPMVYVGRVDCVTGYGEAARHQVWALRRHGLRLKIVDAGSTSSPDPQGNDPFVQAARRDDVFTEATRGTIVHLGPNCTSEWRHHSRPHVLVFVWETSRLPAEWVRIANTFDQVWCATEWQRDVCEASGVDVGRLRVVPFTVDPTLFDNAASHTLKDVREPERTVFGAVFQWTTRKNPVALVEAWLRAFLPTDPVALVLKVYEGDDPSTSVSAHVARIVARRPHAPIRVISRTLSRDDMMAFYRSIDCYVSAHAGEGFGFPIAEALLSGRPVIATDWSAPSEYAEGLFRGVGHVLRPPHGMTWQPFYIPDQRWAQIDVGGLTQAFREAYEKRIEPPLISMVRERFARRLAEIGPAARAALEALS